MLNHNDLLLQILEISISVIYLLILSLLGWGHNGVIIMKIVNRRLCDRSKAVTIIIAWYYYYYSNNHAGPAVIIVRPVKTALV